MASFTHFFHDFRDAAKECKNADKLSAELFNCADKYAAKAKAAKSKRGPDTKPVMKCLVDTTKKYCGEGVAAKYQTLMTSAGTHCPEAEKGSSASTQLPQLMMMPLQLTFLSLR